jgi:glycosyltransferase involved in cell wall biosynthesis
MTSVRPSIQPSQTPLFFWQNMPAHHQTGALDALASGWSAPVTGVWCEDVSASRRSQGWASAHRVSLRDHFLPSSGWEQQVDDLIDGNRTAIHIFSGLGAYAPVTRAARRLARTPDAKMGLIVESPIMLGWVGIARRWKARYHYRPFLGKMRAVFAMGELGLDFYRGLGFAEEKLFPYLYQEAIPLPASRAPDGGDLRLVYAGQLNERKGADILLAACRALPRQGWTLDVFGDGPLRPKLEAEAARDGLAGRIVFRGTVPSSALIAELPRFDLAVVPSRFDGWGMFVNEALQCGLAVVASDRVGAAGLVAGSMAGAIVPSEDIAALAAAVTRRIAQPDLLRDEQAKAREYAPRLSPSRAGEYLAAALRHAFLADGIRPTPGWIA